MRRSFWLALVLAASPMPAFAQGANDVCGDLGRLVAAAQERHPFASVTQRLGAGESVIPGFAPVECRIEATELLCEFSSRARAIYAAWPELDTCPGVAPSDEVLMMDLPPPHTRNAWTRVYRAGDVWIAYGTSCLLCAGESRTWFSVGFNRPVADNQ